MIENKITYKTNIPVELRKDAYKDKRREHIKKLEARQIQESIANGTNKCFWCGGRGVSFMKSSKRWHCSDKHFSHCPKYIEQFKTITNFDAKGNKIETDKLCDYGCGHVAKYTFKNGKVCCGERVSKCAILKNKRSEFMKSATYTSERNKKISLSLKGKTWPKSFGEKISKAKTGKRCGENATRFGKMHTDVSKIKMSQTRTELWKNEKFRARHINNYLNYTFYDKEGKRKFFPAYNKKSIKIIKSYGRKFGYKFQHAETYDRENNYIGEYHIKELGYFLDAYDKERNVVLEIDEDGHFLHGKRKEKDIMRQRTIEQFLGCKFIRLIIPSRKWKKI
jgi:hypothetical protein